MLTLSLEISSLRLVQFSSKEGHLIPLREEVRFFSKAASDQQVLTQEIKESLQAIKKSWDLSDSPLHWIVSSDFTLFRVITFKKSSRFIPTATLVQRDAEEFLPLPLEQVSIAYQKISLTKSDGSRTLAYAAMKTNFLETMTRGIQEAGFSIQKISILPLSLYDSSKPSKEIFLIDFAEQTLSCFFSSSRKSLCQACSYSFDNSSNTLCEQETGLPLLLLAYLKKSLSFLLYSNNLPTLYWIIKTNSEEQKLIQLSLFLKKEFAISSSIIDPCLLLSSNFKDSFIRRLLCRIQFLIGIGQYEHALTSKRKLFWKCFLKTQHSYITHINKFTAPSIRQFRNKQRSLFLGYALGFILLFFSPLSLFCDYFENKKIAIETLTASVCLKQRSLELKKLHQDIEELATTENIERTLQELQNNHDKWPLLINELQKNAPPRGLWITQLTPITKEKKENNSLHEINTLEIKGLYLEGINGEALVHAYASKLASSPLFIEAKKESFIVSCSKEDGSAYAYPFQLKFSLSSPIRQ